MSDIEEPSARILLTGSKCKVVSHSVDTAKSWEYRFSYFKFDGCPMMMKKKA